MSIEPISGGVDPTSTTMMFGDSLSKLFLASTPWKSSDPKDVVMELTILDIKSTEVIGNPSTIGKNGNPNVVATPMPTKTTVLVTDLTGMDHPVMTPVMDTNVEPNQNVLMSPYMKDVIIGVNPSNSVLMKIA